MTIKTVPVYGYKGGLYRELLEGEDPRGSLAVKDKPLYGDPGTEPPKSLVHLPRGGVFLKTRMRAETKEPTLVREGLKGVSQCNNLHRAWGGSTFDLDMSTVRMKQDQSKTWAFKGQPDFDRIWREAQPAEIVQVTTGSDQYGRQLRYLCGLKGSPKPFQVWGIDHAKEKVKEMKASKTTVEVIQ